MGQDLLFSVWLRQFCKFVLSENLGLAQNYLASKTSIGSLPGKKIKWSTWGAVLKEHFFLQVILKKHLKELNSDSNLNCSSNHSYKIFSWDRRPTSGAKVPERFILNNSLCGANKCMIEWNRTWYPISILCIMNKKQILRHNMEQSNKSISKWPLGFTRKSK